MLSLWLASCGGPSPTSPPELCPEGSYDRVGAYHAEVDACIGPGPLEQQCPSLWSWWRDETACPSFDTYVRHARPDPYPYPPTATWGGSPWDTFTTTRCRGNDGSWYDVVRFEDARSGDFEQVDEAVFDVNGQMVWVRFTYYFIGALGGLICCQPGEHATNSEGWGNPVHYDCTDGTVYTPADFPDSADTGAPPTTGETADTGATCR